jgi:hypothetical protein
MSVVSFGLSSLLALAGIVTAVVGISREEWKSAAIGLVLIFGAGVFATLYVGARWATRSASPRQDG